MRQLHLFEQERQRQPAYHQTIRYGCIKDPWMPVPWTRDALRTAIRQQPLDAQLLERFCAEYLLALEVDRRSRRQGALRPSHDLQFPYIVGVRARDSRDEREITLAHELHHWYFRAPDNEECEQEIEAAGVRMHTSYRPEIHRIYSELLRWPKQRLCTSTFYCNPASRMEQRKFEVFLHMG